MLHFYVIIFAFVIKIIVGDKELLEPCKPEGTDWYVKNTVYKSRKYRDVLHAYAICKGKKSLETKVPCDNGYWKYPLPTCAQISLERCEATSLQPYVIRNCKNSTMRVGTTCKYRCMKGYELKGSGMRSCGINLQWTGATPYCYYRPRIFSSLHAPLSFEKENTKNTRVSSSRNSQKKDELCKNSGCEQSCFVRDGIAQCSCSPGLALKDGKYCIDLRETTITIPSTIKSNNRKNMPHLTQRQKSPEELYPCQTDNGGCDQLCQYHNESVQCSCQPGYILRNEVNCEDIDECVINNGNCSHRCINTAGSFYCSCPNGYSLDFNRKICTDINECQTKLNFCAHKCHNTNGSYHCSCSEGFVKKSFFHCIDKNECMTNNGDCSHDCINTHGSFHCSCSTGYQLDIDRKTCIDINECEDPGQNRCNQKCKNTDGSYYCTCKPGYILKNSYECEGCRSNSYRSESDSSCIECPPNSFTDSEARDSIDYCLCKAGFEGDPSLNVPCIDIDECLVDNFNCSHTCVNTPGGAHCSCSLGFELKNNKTCVDIDECSTKNGGCQMYCRNTFGSFNCFCSEGHTLSRDKYSCDDINECAANNGGCSDTCNNFPGGYFCSCPDGYRLDVEGKTCTAISCPAVSASQYSTLRCSPKNLPKIVIRPNDTDLTVPKNYPVHTICRVKCNKGFTITPPSTDLIECLENGSWSSSTPLCRTSHCIPLEIPNNGMVYPPVCIEGPISVKQQCYFTCNQGYHLSGNKSVIKCQNNLAWSYDPPVCESNLIEPFVICPSDITTYLKQNENMANITIPQPITNMEDIKVFPDWITLGESNYFPSGTTYVIFMVNNIDSNATSQCVMTVNVIDIEPPIFVNCPESFDVDGASSRGIVVNWEEPFAIDNIAIQSISKNLEVNSTLTAGTHYVEYTAQDAAGNTANCTFQIKVRRTHCEDLDDPINGKANCIDWLVGKLCRPVCDPGFERDPDQPKFYACGDSVVWTPSDRISPCLQKCQNGTFWSPISESCE